MENTQEPTEEKLKEFQDKMDKFYDDRLPFLRKKHEFDMLTAEIDEARIRSIEARDKFAQYTLQAQKAHDAEKKKQSDEEKKEA